MRILVLNAHPDEGSFSDAALAAYAEGAWSGGHELRIVALRELQFDLVLRGGFYSTKPLEPDIAQQQELIRWCEHLVVVSTNWWWVAPALLKGYIDRVFLPEFAMRYHARFPYVEPLLGGRSARAIYTQNSPWIVGWLFRGDLFWRWISRAVLRHCGLNPVKRLALYRAKEASPEQMSQFLETARKLGRQAA
ncbi:NAD(P)H-dependent oxidoreductase [Methylocystis sp. B8]|uniref:NAD(P)H-dependent oxidoreductase n=1 Tax=Methylocystis sp. B8 TaxID=544938 RepID=UPI0010FE79C9|nr:NAD(P)H-dependent oxidoreductase [Methylocystis sp. B8]TLG77818.1 flavodoxin family protein [Methylocystis sp. B8]